MTSIYHATHESPYADDCPDCAGYTDSEWHPDRIGVVLQLALVLVAIAAIAVIVRLAVSR